MQTPNHGLQQQLSSNAGVSGFMPEVCLEKEWTLTARLLAESVNNFYTEGFPQGIILVS